MDKMNRAFLRAREAELNKLSAEYVKKRAELKERLFQTFSVDIYEEFADLFALKYDIQRKQALIEAVRKGVAD